MPTPVPFIRLLSKPFLYSITRRRSWVRSPVQAVLQSRRWRLSTNPEYEHGFRHALGGPRLHRKTGRQCSGRHGGVQLQVYGPDGPASASRRGASASLLNSVQRQYHQPRGWKANLNLRGEPASGPPLKTSLAESGLTGQKDRGGPRRCASNHPRRPM